MDGTCLSVFGSLPGLPATRTAINFRGKAFVHIERKPARPALASGSGGKLDGGVLSAIGIEWHVGFVLNSFRKLLRGIATEKTMARCADSTRQSTKFVDRELICGINATNVRYSIFARKSRRSSRFLEGDGILTSLGVSDDQRQNCRAPYCPDRPHYSRRRCRWSRGPFFPRN